MRSVLDLLDRPEHEHAVTVQGQCGLIAFPAGTGICHQDRPAACVTRNPKGAVLVAQERHKAGHEGCSDASDLYKVEQLIWLVKLPDFLPIMGFCECRLATHIFHNISSSDRSSR
jgi:hypothetical protein